MYTPDRTVVPLFSAALSFYRNRGYGDGTVNLNRNSGAMMPIGLFCYEVPDAAEDIQPLCVNIGKATLIQLLNPQICYSINTCII